MVKIYFFCVLLLFSFSGFAQKTLWSVGLSSGMYRYIGHSAAKGSFILHPVFVASYTNNPYGNQFGFCYGLAGGVERVTKQHWKFGAELAYEIVNSKIAITHVSLDFSNPPVTGNTQLRSSTLNCFPHLGYRIPIKKVNIDLTPGLDFTYIFNTKEWGKATDANGLKYTTEVDRTTIHFDVRLRMQLEANYKNWSSFVGYAAGLSNHMNGYVGGVNDAKSSMIRFGMKWTWSKKIQTL
jgi:hypothetical protein